MANLMATAKTLISDERAREALAEATDLDADGFVLGLRGTCSTRKPSITFAEVAAAFQETIDSRMALSAHEYAAKRDAARIHELGTLLEQARTELHDLREGLERAAGLRVRR